MGYKALVTLDLPHVSEEIRDSFNDMLEVYCWTKINGLSSSWKVSFRDGGTHTGAIRTLETHIRHAKQATGVSTVRYAMQVSKDGVVRSV